MVPQGSVGEVERFLEAQGLNARALLDGARQATATAGDALEIARPTVDSTVSTVSSTLSSTDPVVLAEYAAGLVALYYLVRLRSKVGRFVWVLCEGVPIPVQQAIVMLLLLLHCTTCAAADVCPHICRVGLHGRCRDLPGVILSLQV